MATFKRSCHEVKKKYRNYTLKSNCSRYIGIFVFWKKTNKEWEDSISFLQKIPKKEFCALINHDNSFHDIVSLYLGNENAILLQERRSC